MIHALSSVNTQVLLGMSRSKRSTDLQEQLTAREVHIRESWIRAMEAKIVRDQLTKCQRVEGVNHYENCKELSTRYLTMLRENKVKGYKNIDT